MNIYFPDTNAACLVPLVHEYQVQHVMKRCVEILVKQPPSIHNLILAERFSLPDLRTACIEYVKAAPYSELEKDPEFNMINKETLFEVFQHKLNIYEGKDPYKTTICKLVSSPPSIQNLFLAEKYNVPDVYSKCLQYLKDTPLRELKTEVGFGKLKAGTLIEVLRHKVERHESGRMW